MARALPPAVPATPAPTMFQPYVAATESPAEFTLKAIVSGALFGLLFGASTVYLGLRAGLTVSASIPIAGGALTGILYAALFGNNLVPEADGAEALAPISFLHDGASGMIAGALLFTALGAILGRVAGKKL